MSQYNHWAVKQYVRCFDPGKLLRCVLFGLISLGFLSAFFLVNGSKVHAATDTSNSAVQYADSHWNWEWNSTSGLSYYTVGANAGQANFECAEFVARALTTEGLTPGRDANNSTSDQYASYDGYNLRIVGDLYHYLIDNGLGTDIGNNPAQASPGDAVFYQDQSGTWFHTTLVVQVNGNNTLVDGHNIAQFHVPYYPFYDEYGNPAAVTTIVHLISPGSSGGSGTGATTTSASAVDVKYADGSQDLIAVGKDGRMWHNWASASGSWIGWNWWSTSTPFANATPTLVKYADGSMDLIAVGSDGRMWHNWASASGSWTGWNWWSTSTPFAAASPTLVKYANGSQDLIAVGKDGRMWHNWASASGSWIGWNWWSTSTPFAAASPTLVKYADGSMDLIAVGSDGRMWHNWASASGSWTGWNWWSNSTPFAAASPTLVTYANGDIDLIAVGSDGHMWHRWGTAAGSWIDWNWFGNAANFE